MGMIKMRKEIYLAWLDNVPRVSYYLQNKTKWGKMRWDKIKHGGCSPVNFFFLKLTDNL